LEKRNRFIISLMLALVVEGFNCFGQIVSLPPVKKLIDFSQHSPVFSELKGSFSDYEKGPFDGLSVKISKEAGNGDVFMVDSWAKVNPEVLETERKLAFSQKQSTILTDNFLVIFGASQMDWFSDEDWAKVETHLRYAAQMAKVAHFKGILWDAEPYKPGKNPWKYLEQEKAGQYSFEEYYNQPMGYKMLVEMGLKNLTFEAVIANHPEEFSIEAVKKAIQRLEEFKILLTV
jgi:hypothetical protein